ncbi:MAG: RNA 2',3'-cyclic phosphodiesterase [Gemmatimonadales bacterium]
MRLFLALELERATTELLALALAPLRVSEPAIAWVPPDRLHLTLKFLGDADERRVVDIAGALESIGALHHPFEMALGGVGAFPNFRRPRIVWLGVESEPRLELLHHDLELACAELGYDVEGRPFRPHVTLARVRDPLPTARALALARAARSIAVSVMEPVERLTLFDSTPGPAALRYRRLHAATLGGR